jgi:hypothetical protein
MNDAEYEEFSLTARTGTIFTPKLRLFDMVIT